MTTATRTRQSVTCESFQNNKATYQLLRTYRLLGGLHKVRVNILHDSSYPRQSSYTASTWIPSAGWVEVDRILGDDPRGAGMSSGYASPELVIMSVEQMAATLVANASAILER